jgi:hypothetical protein
VDLEIELQIRLRGPNEGINDPQMRTINPGICERFLFPHLTRA